MEFSGHYLDYDEYKELGGTLAETPFDLLEFEARRKIDENTFNRLKELDVSEIPIEVKVCDFNLINSQQAYEQSLNEVASSGSIKSENTDGYSVSYGTASDISTIVKSKNDEQNDIIKTYLSGVIVNGQHILYRGTD